MGLVLGLDLSLTATGLAEVEDGAIVSTYRVRSTGKKDDDLEARHKRLTKLASDIIGFVAVGGTELAVVESPAYGAKYGSPHDRSGLWWTVVSGLLVRSIPVATVAPMSRAKYGTGRGNARKGEVLEAVKVRYGPYVEDDYGIPDDNVADAILLAAMGARILGRPVHCEVDLTEKHLESLKKMAMPDGLVAA